MTKEEVIERLKDIPYMDILENADYIAIARAAKMLTNATIWTPCSERMPTEDDADGYGDVNTIDHDGTTCFLQWDEVEFASNVYAWSRIKPIGGGNG